MRRGGDGLGLDAHEGQHQRDGEEHQQRRPEVRDLLGVQHGEEEAGEHGGEDERRGGERGGGLPAGASFGGARQGDPVVGDGEGGKRKPRKQISSKTGATKVPKRVMIHAVAGVRKNSSMGMVLGEEMKAVTICIMTPSSKPSAIEPRCLGARGGPVPLQAVEEVGGARRAGRRATRPAG